MTTLFWFALVVGGGLLLVSMVGHVLGDLMGDATSADAGGGDVGGADADASGDFDSAASVDADADAGALHLDAGALHADAGALHADAGALHADAAHGGAAGGHAHGDQQGFRFLSLRTATYFLFGFGASGVLLTWAWGGAHPLVAGAGALLIGFLTSWLSALLFRWVSRDEAGALASDRALVGATGVVTLPLSAEHTGKVLVHAGNRDLELLARPVEDPEAGDPAEWKDVLVVEVEDGVAVVSSYAAPEA